MCNHHNIIRDEDGTSTCADCYMHFNKILCNEFTTNYNGKIINLLETKSSTITLLETEFGINDAITTSITEKIFNLVSKHKMVRGANRRSLLCASLYYAYYYLKKPQNLETMISKFQINNKQALKSFKLCQLAIQESPNLEKDLQIFKDQICCCSSTHKEKLEELILKYNIPLKNYEEIEKIVVFYHNKKNKILNNCINNLWISSIFYWLHKINPYLEPEDFISIHNDYITLHRLKADFIYLKRHIPV